MPSTLTGNPEPIALKGINPWCLISMTILKHRSTILQPNRHISSDFRSNCNYSTGSTTWYFFARSGTELELHNTEDNRPLTPEMTKVIYCIHIQPSPPVKQLKTPLDIGPLLQMTLKISTWKRKAQSAKISTRIRTIE